MNTLTRKLATVTAFSAVVVATHAHAHVYVVNQTGGADFTNIQAAVSAATDGDVILVKPGNYLGFTIDDKALAVVGEDDLAWVSVNSSIRVENLALGKTVTLARLHANAGGGGPNPTQLSLDIDGCAGAVRAVQSVFYGSFNGGSVTPPKGAGVRVHDSHDVAFAVTTIIGGVGSSLCPNAPRPGSPGLTLESATVAAYDCSIFGGIGSSGFPTSGEGGAGAEFVDRYAGASSLFASNTKIQGGQGATSLCQNSPLPGNGGPGLRMLPTSVVQLVGPMLFGGFPGVAPPPPASQPSAGVQVVGGTPFVYGVTGVNMSLPAVAREGATISLSFSGAPGDHVYVNESLATIFQWVPSWRGVLIVPFPSSLMAGAPLVRRVGVIGASGGLTVQYHVPLLAPGASARTRYLQGYRLNASGLTLAAFSTLTVLDSSF